MDDFDDLVPSAAPLRAAPLRWRWRLGEIVSAYLPVLLMALLALGSWWLVKNTPDFQPGKPVAPSKHEPDYTMKQFTVQRFAADGRLRAQIEGDELRHYPDTDTVEIDTVHLRALAPGPQVTVAIARRALVNGDATEVQLLGGAQVVRETADGAPAIEFRGEFLHAFVNTERVRSHLPVTVRRGGVEFHANALEFNGLDRIVQMKGRVRAVFMPATAKRAGTYTQPVAP